MTRPPGSWPRALFVRMIFPTARKQVGDVWFQCIIISSYGNVMMYNKKSIFLYRAPETLGVS